MSIFSIIAEAKILDWTRRKKAGEIVEPETAVESLRIKPIESSMILKHSSNKQKMNRQKKEK